MKNSKLLKGFVLLFFVGSFASLVYYQVSKTKKGVEVEKMGGSKYEPYYLSTSYNIVQDNSIQKDSNQIKDNQKTPRTTRAMGGTKTSTYAVDLPGLINGI